MLCKQSKIYRNKCLKEKLILLENICQKELAISNRSAEITKLTTTMKIRT